VVLAVVELEILLGQVRLEGADVVGQGVQGEGHGGLLGGWVGGGRKLRRNMQLKESDCQYQAQQARICNLFAKIREFPLAFHL